MCGAVGYLSVQSPEPAILVAWRTFIERPNVAVVNHPAIMVIDFAVDHLALT
jgi:hypothetical protein